MNRYAISDLHGRYDLWTKIKNKLHSDDILYNLGDSIDRGPDGYKICLDLMQMKNVHCICGNHEMMAISALPRLLKGEFHSKEVSQWFWNGGNATWDQIESRLIGYKRDAHDYCCSELIAFFKNMPNIYNITNKNNQHIILSHAGFTPSRKEEAEIGWDRKHFLDSWPIEKQYQNTYVIHGHTPVQYLQKTLNKISFTSNPEIITYADGHKIDIDLGAVISNRVALLNLDTLEVQYIE